MTLGIQHVEILLEAISMARNEIKGSGILMKKYALEFSEERLKKARRKFIEKGRGIK